MDSYQYLDDSLFKTRSNSKFSLTSEEIENLLPTYVFNDDFEFSELKPKLTIFKSIHIDHSEYSQLSKHSTFKNQAIETKTRSILHYLESKYDQI